MALIKHLPTFIKLNLIAYWKRLKKRQWPWAPFKPTKNRDLPRDTLTQVPVRTEKYLRPVPGIDPRAPEIVALAVKLGMNEKSPREFAEAAYDYVKNDIFFSAEVPPGRDVVGVLRGGYGLCIDKMSVLVALARTAGIPARFRLFEQELAEGSRSALTDWTEMAQDVYRMHPSYTHGCVELLLDDVWVAADCTWTDEEEAGMELPITQFGQDPDGNWYFIFADSVRTVEGLYGRRMRRRFEVMLIITFLLRGPLDLLAEHFHQVQQRGKKILAEMGKEAYMENKKKFYVPVPWRQS